MPRLQWMYQEDAKIKSTNKQWKKLVDYYNQMREERFWEKWYFKYTNIFDNVHIISKSMWFINWLVENNKIDLFQLATYIEYHSDYRFIANRELRDRNVDEDHLLMLLSIEDNPITFLLSILK